jgi:hypothetical protein
MSALTVITASEFFVIVLLISVKVTYHTPLLTATISFALANTSVPL